MTSKAGHTFTAGPWNAVGMLVFSGVDRFYNHPVARVGAPLDKNDNRVEEAEANARLIAAAPDLLEACQDLWCAFSDTDDPVLRTIAIKARAAIAKATAGGAV